ncbi:MAG TPA: chaperone modulator CbpM [Ktedonosporobacter sp.]|jgi:MerR family transcriptional regulator/heat shock protein HspR|nr:chaperone modulator CbpM [Ktedonosporobacter sp.]
MNEQCYTRIILGSSQTTSYYSEEETAQYCRMEVQFIRQLYDAGIIEGIDVPGEERRFSEEDMTLLRRIRRLHQDLGVNLEGIGIIMRLQARLEALQRELEQYKQ